MLKCPTLGPIYSINTLWFPIVWCGRGMVGHTIDRCIVHIHIDSG